MENASDWENLYRVEPFRHRWLPKSLLSTSPRTKALVLIWGVLGVILAVLFLIVAWLEGSFFLEEGVSLVLECAALEKKLEECGARGLSEDLVGLVTLVSVPILFSIAAIVFPRLWTVLDSLKNVIAQAPPAGPIMPEAPESALDSGHHLSAYEFNCMLKGHEETILGQNNSKYLD